MRRNRINIPKCREKTVRSWERVVTRESLTTRSGRKGEVYTYKKRLKKSLSLRKICADSQSICDNGGRAFGGGCASCLSKKHREDTSSTYAYVHTYTHSRNRTKSKNNKNHTTMRIHFSRNKMPLKFCDIDRHRFVRKQIERVCAKFLYSECTFR